MHDRRDAGHAHAKDGEAVGVCRPPLQSGLATIRDVVYAGGQIGAVRVFAMTGAAAASAGCLPSSVYAWANAHLEEGGAGLAMGRDEDAPDAGGVEELRRQVEAL